MISDDFIKFGSHCLQYPNFLHGELMASTIFGNLLKQKNINIILRVLAFACYYFELLRSHADPILSEKHIGHKNQNAKREEKIAIIHYLPLACQ